MDLPCRFVGSYHSRDREILTLRLWNAYTGRAQRRLSSSCLEQRPQYKGPSALQRQVPAAALGADVQRLSKRVSTRLAAFKMHSTLAHAQQSTASTAGCNPPAATLSLPPR